MDKRTLDSMKTEFVTAVTDNISRDGIVELMGWLEGTDFYVAPASTRFHGSYEGGLLEHSLAVYKRLVQFSDYFDREMFGGAPDYTWDKETIAIVALFHDICKIGCYKTEMRWRKDKNQKWEQYPTYKKDEDFNFGGHGSKSLYLIQNFMRLEPEEAVAINCHMGQFDSTIYSNPSAAYEQFPLAWLLHIADEAATYIDHK